jgi:acid stress-induced BolA-like protein IbaG/YrbA
VSVVAVLTARAGMSEIVVSGEYNHYILIYVSSGMKSNKRELSTCQLFSCLGLPSGNCG